MNLQHPESLFLLLGLPLVVLVLVRSYRQGQVDLRHLAGEWRWHRFQKVYFLKSFLQGILILGALLFLVLGLADFHWGTNAVEESEEGMDLALAVDVSRSMLVPDSLPDRLGRTGEWIMNIMANFPDSQFSLVVFKGRALTLVPLTRDREVIQNLLPSLGPGYLSSTGTSLESGLSEAFRSLDFPGNRHRAVVLFSDGEGTQGNPASAAQQLRDERMATFVVGMGTNEGGSIPLAADQIVRDERGRPVISRRNPGVLRSLARLAGGDYYDGNSTAEFSRLVEDLSRVERPEGPRGVRLESVPRYRLFVLLALLLLVAGRLVRIVPWKKSL